jgi:hypothetical protein
MTPNAPLEAQNVQIISPKYVNASSILFKKKMNWAKGRPKINKKTDNAFVLPTITSTCTQNVERCHHYLHKMEALSQDMLLGKIKYFVRTCL